MKRLLLLIAACMVFMSGCSAAKESLPKIQDSNLYIERSAMDENPYDTLCVPTQMTKVGDDYFIIDCYHNQILVSSDKSLPLSSWRVVTDKIDKGHTIAGDGVVYLADDTENNRVLVFAKENDAFYLMQTFEDIGKRPHYIEYNEKDGIFYCLSSLTGELYLFKRDKGSYNVSLDRTVQLEGLDGIYIRSFSFIDNLMYLPAGCGMVFAVSTKDFSYQGMWDLTPELGGPVQISKLNGKYYLTVSTDINGASAFANIVRADSMEDFGKGNYESVRESFCMDGTPYVITGVDDEYYLCVHSDNGSNCLWSFKIDSSDNINAKRVFDGL